MTPRLTKTRLLLPAGLLAGGVVAGGLLAVLATFVALLLVLDQALDRVLAGTGQVDAQRRYLRLAHARRRAELARRLRRRPPTRLAYLPTETGWAAVARRRRLGVQPIALASIVGTVDAHKAEAFDGEFRPPAWSRGRWTVLCIAAQRGAALPPIAVYRAGAEHFVRDGHHRVSVARATGATEIDAEVVELA